MEGLLWQIEKRRAVAMGIGDCTSAAEPKTADEVWWDLQCNQTQKWRKFAGEMTGHAYLAGEDNEAIIGNYAPNVGATAADVHGLQHAEWNRCATESHDMDPCVGSILHSTLAIPAEELMDGAPEAMIEKTVERRRKRLMKNRESAARSRARKLAYTTQLESRVTELKAENATLKADQHARRRRWGSQSDLEKEICYAPLPLKMTSQRCRGSTGSILALLSLHLAPFYSILVLFLHPYLLRALLAYFCLLTCLSLSQPFLPIPPSSYLSVRLAP